MEEVQDKERSSGSGCQPLPCITELREDAHEVYGACERQKVRNQTAMLAWTCELHQSDAPSQYSTSESDRLLKCCISLRVLRLFSFVQVTTMSMISATINGTREMYVSVSFSN